MKLARFGDAGSERPGVILPDGSWIDVSAHVRDYDEAFFAGDGIAKLRAWGDGERWLAPKVPGTFRGRHFRGQAP